MRGRCGEGVTVSGMSRSHQRPGVSRGHGLVAVALAGWLAVASCSSHDHGNRPAGNPADGQGAPTGSTPAAPGPGLESPSTCRASFTCAILEVPLDRADPGHGTMRLRVAVESDVSADRGVLLVLAGGPGQAGVPLVERLVDNLGGDVVHGYRIAVLDQRGTGATALRCLDLQRAMGFSDLTPPSASAVRSCARIVGNDREFYSTDDVVTDLDQLRRALGAEKMTLYGTSYGTFVAEQYALAYPGRTRALVWTRWCRTAASTRSRWTSCMRCGGCFATRARRLAVLVTRSTMPRWSSRASTTASTCSTWRP
jgi:hypothetical protein